MEFDTQIANAAAKFVDCKWALSDKIQGYDCLNYLLTFYEDLGVKMDHEFEGITRETYKDLWEKDFKKALKVATRWYRTLGKVVEFPYMQRGDLLLFEYKEFKSLFSGIYLGNGHVLLIFGVSGSGKNIGGRVLPLAFVGKQLIEVRRLLQEKKDQSQKLAPGLLGGRG